MCDLSNKKLSFKISVFKIRGVNFASVNHCLFVFYASYIFMVDSTLSMHGYEILVPSLSFMS